MNSPDRLVQPLVRVGDEFQPTTWDGAFTLIARRLLEMRQDGGDDAIGFISSSKCTNEENYLMQKLARAVMHTHNIDNCSRYCQAPATEGLRRTMGYGGDSGSISDLAQADLVMIVGANPAESHPVLSTRIRRAHKLHGQKLIVADLRKNPMAERADVFLHPRPASDLVWISALTKYILDQGKENKTFLANRVTGLAEYRATLDRFTLEYAEEVTGIPQAVLIRVAEMIVSAAEGVYRLGDGRDPAHGWQRHLHGALQSVIGDGQRRSPRNRRLSAAWPQQRAGCGRLRVQPCLHARLRASDRPSSEREVREHLGRGNAHHEGTRQSLDG